MRPTAISKRDTPFTAAEAMRLLGLDAVEYHLAVANGLLPQNVRLVDDPGDRLRFHSFWDLLSYALYSQNVRLGHPQDRARQVADVRCEDLAGIVGNVVTLGPSHELITYIDNMDANVGREAIIDEEELEALDLHDRLARVSLSAIRDHQLALASAADNLRNLF